MYAIDVSLSDPHSASFVPSSSTPTSEQALLSQALPTTTTTILESSTPSIPPFHPPIVPSTSADPTLTPHQTTSST